MPRGIRLGRPEPAQIYAHHRRQGRRNEKRHTGSAAADPPCAFDWRTDLARPYKVAATFTALCIPALRNLKIPAARARACTVTISARDAHHVTHAPAAA